MEEKEAIIWARGEGEKLRVGQRQEFGVGK